MKRLTIKHNCIGTTTYEKAINKSQYDIKGCNLTEIFDKLGQLEDFEKEFGIDLIALCKVLKQQKVYCIIEDTIIENSFSVKLVFEYDDYYLRIDGCHYVRIADYGKTWSLTKEELE